MPWNSVSTSGKNRRRAGWILGAALGLGAQLGWAVLADAGTPFTAKGTQPGITHEIEYAYAFPGQCENCHGDYDKDEDIEPFTLWSGSMMANAGRDPVFWAAVDVANEDLPGSGEFCLRCHAPKAWLEGRANAGAGTVGDADGCALEGNIDEASSSQLDNDFEGVTCHLCHRMMINDTPPKGEETVYTENAQFWIDDDSCANVGVGEGPELGNGPCRRGPYDYTMADPEPPHEWEYSEYHTESRFCGNCHNVTSPAKTLIDENGVDTGIPYPIERTFAEWQESDYSIDMGPSFERCQDCHMPQVSADPAYACLLQPIDRTGDMAGHDFVGGNIWVPGLIRDQYGTTIDNDDGYDTAIARAEQMLASAAQVELLTPGGVAADGTLRFEVRVTNLGGHKLPTGYNEGRRMWLHVEVEEGDGDVIWESGAYDDGTGDLIPKTPKPLMNSDEKCRNKIGTHLPNYFDWLVYYKK